MPAASVSSENTKPARISSRPCCIQKGRLSSQTASLLPKTTNCRATPGRRHEKDYFRIFPSLRRSALMLCMERTLQIHLENMADASPPETNDVSHKLRPFPELRSASRRYGLTFFCALLSASRAVARIVAAVRRFNRATPRHYSVLLVWHILLTISVHLLA